jgi:hypothetical protein
MLFGTGHSLVWDYLLLFFYTLAGFELSTLLLVMFAFTSKLKWYRVKRFGKKG